MAFIDGSSSQVEAGRHFFRYLQTIELIMPLAPSVRSARSLGQHVPRALANMAALLAEAQELRHLTVCLHWSPVLDMTHDYIPPHEPLFPYLGLNAKWPQLRSFELEGVRAEYQDVKDFIARHQTTLEALKFSWCSLYSGQWSSIVDEVVHGTRIRPFVLDKVHEEVVGDMPIQTIPDDELDQWQYEGHIEVNANGDRYFDEPAEKSVYAWRNRNADGE